MGMAYSGCLPGTQILYRTNQTNQTDALFIDSKVCWVLKCKWVLKSTLPKGRYRGSLSGKGPPQGITEHSIRGATMPAAFKEACSLGDICKAATLSFLNTFFRHYHIAVAALAKATFGRKDLQKLVPPSMLPLPVPPCKQVLITFHVVTNAPLPPTENKKISNLSLSYGGRKGSIRSTAWFGRVQLHNTHIWGGREIS